MDTRRGITSIAVCGLLVLSISATRFMAAGSHVSSPAGSEVEACTLLTAADASKALEVSSVSGKRVVASDPKGCIWSNDAAASDSSRRVALVTHTLVSFQAAKHPAITTIKIEPVAGIGDEAFYQIYPGDNPPFIWVRKGRRGQHPNYYPIEADAIYDRAGEGQGGSARKGGGGEALVD